MKILANTNSEHFPKDYTHTEVVMAFLYRMTPPVHDSRYTIDTTGSFGWSLVHVPNPDFGVHAPLVVARWLHEEMYAFDWSKDLATTTLQDARLIESMADLLKALLHGAPDDQVIHWVGDLTLLKDDKVAELALLTATRRL